jgi:nucleoside-triphosphatase THEP1
MESESASPTLHSLRVAVLGDPGVGKKTYIQKLAKKQN